LTGEARACDGSPTSDRDTSEQEFSMRRPGRAAPGFLLLGLLLLASLAAASPVAALQEASPAAGTPAAQGQPASLATPTPPPAAPAAATPAPAATAAPAAAQTDVVTLVLWYANAANADILELHPLATDAGFVASPATGAAPAGTVDFPAEGVPTIVVGDTTFESYPRADGTVERWTWFDDVEGARPATLVLQIAGLDGKYANYYGTGTFLSRDEGGAGGVLIIALRPPNPEAVATAEQAATADAAAQEQGADQSVTEEAPAADASVDPAQDVVEVAPAEIPAEDQNAVEPAE
jgi:hypothetical protein